MHYGLWYAKVNVRVVSGALLETIVSQKIEIPGENPAKHILYIIRTVKERTFTISGCPTCSNARLTLNVVNIGQTTKCMPNTIVL